MRFGTWTKLKPTRIAPMIRRMLLRGATSMICSRSRRLDDLEAMRSSRRNPYRRTTYNTKAVTAKAAIAVAQVPSELPHNSPFGKFSNNSTPPVIWGSHLGCPAQYKWMILWGKGRTAWLSTVGLGAESVRQRVHPHFLKYTAFRQTIRLQAAQAVELLQHEFHVGAASLGGALVQHGAQADGKTVVFRPGTEQIG